MNLPERSFTPTELAERIANETAHMPEDQALLSWPPVLRAMSVPADEFSDFSHFEPEQVSDRTFKGMQGTLRSDIGNSTFAVFSEDLQKSCYPKTILFPQERSVFSSLKHLHLAEVIVDFELEDLRHERGQITAIHAIEAPRRRFQPGHFEGYSRGRVLEVYKEEDDEGYVVKGLRMSTDPDSTSTVHAVGLGGPGGMWYRDNVGLGPIMPQADDIIATRFVDYDPQADAIRAVSFGLVYRPGLNRS